MERKIPDELALAVAERRAILFAGAGLSMTIGLPSWDELIDHMMNQLGIQPGGLPQAGSHHALAEYYRIRQGSIGPLRSWMDRKWRLSEEQVRGSKVHRLVVDLDFPILYTTNYDRNIESAFKIHGREYVKVANARDIAKTREGIPQIVKFHGDFDDDDSLVLTESDYFSRLAFDSPLDVKFRSDALGKTVLFIGYSMTDHNIRLLLHNIWRTWQRSGYGKDRPPSFVFMVPHDPVQEAILSEWGITVLTDSNEDAGLALTGFLENLKERVEHFRHANPERAGGALS